MSAPDPSDAQSLLAAVQQWAQKALPAPPSGHSGPECQWCPLCQLASALRGEHPELTERLAEAGAAVGTAVRLLLESATNRPDEAGSSDDPAAKAPAAGARPPRPRVQRIVLDDETPED